MTGDVEVRWTYRPDDRSMQGTTERLPRDLARMKVREGLAVYVPAVDTDAETDVESPAGQPALIVTDNAGKSTKQPVVKAPADRDALEA